MCGPQLLYHTLHYVNYAVNTVISACSGMCTSQNMNNMQKVSIEKYPFLSS